MILKNILSDVQADFKKSVIKFIEKRVPKEKFVIEEKLKILKLNPYPNDFLDIKKLSNSEYYRLRSNYYRFIYEIIEDELVILMVKSDNRGDIYQPTPLKAESRKIGITHTFKTFLVSTLNNAAENESPLLTKKRNNSICGKKALQIVIYFIDSNYYR